VRLPRGPLTSHSPGGRYRRALLSAILDASECNTVGITLAFTLQFPFFPMEYWQFARKSCCATLPPLAEERHVGQNL
jgi:hypothetical protein